MGNVTKADALAPDFDITNILSGDLPPLSTEHCVNRVTVVDLQVRYEMVERGLTLEQARRRAEELNKSINGSIYSETEGVLLPASADCHYEWGIVR